MTAQQWAIDKALRHGFIVRRYAISSSVKKSVGRCRSLPDSAVGVWFSLMMLAPATDVAFLTPNDNASAPFLPTAPFRICKPQILRLANAQTRLIVGPATTREQTVILCRS